MCHTRSYSRNYTFEVPHTHICIHTGLIRTYSMNEVRKSINRNTTLNKEPTQHFAIEVAVEPRNCGFYTIRTNGAQYKDVESFNQTCVAHFGALISIYIAFCSAWKCGRNQRQSITLFSCWPSLDLWLLLAYSKYSGNVWALFIRVYTIGVRSMRINDICHQHSSTDTQRQ